MHATLDQEFNERVVAIIGHQLPRTLPPNATLAEFRLDGDSVLQVEIACRSFLDLALRCYPPPLYLESPDWTTFRDVMASCTRHHLRGIVLGRDGCTYLVKPDEVVRSNCHLPWDFDLTRIGLDYERCRRIHFLLTHGDDHRRDPLCRDFPLVLVTKHCRTTWHIINLAHGRALWPKRIAPEVLPARAA